MTNENQHDGVIRINTKSELNYEDLVGFFNRQQTPNDLKIAISLYNSKLRADLNFIRAKTKEVQDALMQNLIHDQIPIETREREEELRKALPLDGLIKRSPIRLEFQRAK